MLLDIQSLSIGTLDQNTAKGQNGTNYMDSIKKEAHKKELQRQIAKTLGTRINRINVTNVITDDNGASLVKFTWIRNCDTYLAVVAGQGKIQIYREIQQ